MKQEIKSKAELLVQFGERRLLSPVTLTRTGSIRAAEGQYDAFMEGSWGNEQATFIVECKRIGTPKEFAGAVLQIQSWNLPQDWHPLLLMPYLKPEQLDELDRLGLSGVDLCGNGVITIEGRLKVYRTGYPNQFRSRAAIKNVYRGKTSLVARVFATRSSFPTVQALREAIIERDLMADRSSTKPIGLSTVSKALKTLEQDLIVTREQSGGIRLLQRDRLLDRLLRSDQPLDNADRIRLKVDVSDQDLIDWIADKIKPLGMPVVATGLSSTSRYAVMQRGPVVQLYTPQLSLVANALSAKEVDRFENIELIESQRSVDYFDANLTESFPWASPLQTWLELMRGDKRDRETAEQVREWMLKLEDNA